MTRKIPQGKWKKNTNNIKIPQGKWEKNTNNIKSPKPYHSSPVFSLLLSTYSSFFISFDQPFLIPHVKKKYNVI